MKNQTRLPLNFFSRIALATALGIAVQGFAAGPPAFSDANWISLDPSVAADGPVSGSAVDGSGNLYICGSFSVVNDVVANGLAKWDGTRWSTLGSGVNGSVSALAALGNDVYVAGAFTTAGGFPATNIAKWNGSSWSAVGTGVGVTDPYAFVTALAASGGNVYAAVGSGAPNVVNYTIYKWDGSTWTTLGSGLNGGVYALAASGADLYAGGWFFAIVGGSQVNRIAKWDGSSWSGLGTTTPGVDAPVYALLISGADLYVGGFFSKAGGNVQVNGLAKWDGTNWSAAAGSGLGLNGSANALAMSGGDLYVGGAFTNVDGVAANNIAKWDGNTWTPLGSGLEAAAATVAVSGGNVYAGVAIEGGVGASHISGWDGANWSALSSGWAGGPPRVFAVAASATTVYVSGLFSIPQPGGGAVSNLAQGDGTNWTSLGSGLNGGASALAVSGSDLYAGGGFTTAGGVPASNIAKWDGSAWSALGLGLNGGVSALAVSGSDLYAGGGFTTAGGAPATNIARWDGSSWTPLGAGLNGSAIALAVSGSNVYAGVRYVAPRSGPPYTGPPPLPDYQIFQWDGNTWTQLGSVGGNVVYPTLFSLAVLGGNLYVGGYFSDVSGVTANNIAKWDGTSWTPLGSGANSDGGVYALATFGHDLFAAGQITTAGGIPANNIARWDGSSWTPLGSGMGGYYSWLRALSVFGSDLYAGGGFTIAGGKVSGYVARASLNPSTRDPSTPPPVASFSADTSSGRAPLTVQFTDHSIGDISSWRWDFGDGSPASARQNPAHTYTMIGDHMATLTVNGNGSGTNSLLISVKSGNGRQLAPKRQKGVNDN
jgi:hypothetical protein